MLVTSILSITSQVTSIVELIINRFSSVGSCVILSRALLKSVEITSSGGPLRLACWITSRTVLDASVYSFPLINPNFSVFWMIPISLCILSGNIFEYNLKYPSSIDRPLYESGSVQTLPGVSKKITVLQGRIFYKICGYSSGKSLYFYSVYLTNWEKLPVFGPFSILL